MTTLLYSLLGGIFFIIAIFVLLNKFTGWGAKVIAGLLALLVIGIYVPVAIVFWPGADVFAIQLALYLLSTYVMGIIGAQRASHVAAGSTKQWFHWGPAAITGFFLFIIVVDSILIVVAQKGLHMDVALQFLPKPKSGGEVSSFFPGTVTHDFREKEDQFNEYTQMRKAQQQRNWQVKKGWQTKPYANQAVVFMISVQDKLGQAIHNAEVKGEFIRPANSKLDQTFTMQETKAGFYQVTLNLPEPGTWDLILLIKQGEAKHEVRARTEILKIKKD